tara:strand:+ start:1298 stop:1711 length:414 start_codon:yes stop_codon:yes gene_type:complete
MLLEPLEADGVSPRVSTVVVPVLDADRILLTPTIAANAADLSAGGSIYVPYFTVPEGQEWRLLWGARNLTAANSSYRVKVGGTDYPITNPGTVAQVGIDLRGLTLRAGDTAGMTSTGNGGDSDIAAYISYDRLDLGE